MDPRERKQRLDAARRRWRRGDDREETFRDIVAQLYGPLEAYFRRQGISSDLAHDLTQESFVGIYRGLDAFRDDSSFTTWAFTIAKNNLKKAHRSRLTQKRGAGEEPVSLEDQLSEPPAPRPDPLRQVLDREEKERLRRAVDALPSRMRTVLTMHLYQQRSRQDIADALGVSAETVKTQLAQARRKLAGALSPQPETPASDTPRSSHDG